jgi:hypothetical protein
LALWAGYSYSSPYVYSGNATQYGLTWSIDTVLGTTDEAEVNSVVYRYTTDKITEDDMDVSVFNENIEGGYIFNQTDDWSGLPSSTIQRYLPLDNVSSKLFGTGGINVTGNGTVNNSSVIFNYRIKPQYPVEESTALFIPDIDTVDIYNALDDDAVKSEQTDPDYSDDEEEEQDDDERARRAERAGNAAVGNALAVAQNAMLQAMVMATDMSVYYAASIDGGVYKDSTALVDAKLPENRAGLRNGLAQQILHTKMVEMQYKR